MDNYSNAGGCGWAHPFSKKRREECNERYEEKQAAKTSATQKEADANLLLAQAAATQAAKQEQDKWSPLAVTGVIMGSMLAIGLLVLIIKRAKK